MSPRYCVLLSICDPFPPMTINPIFNRLCSLAIAIVVWMLYAPATVASTTDSSDDEQTANYYILHLDRGENVYLNAHAELCTAPDEPEIFLDELQGDNLRALVALELAHTTKFYNILRKQNSELLFYHYGHTKKDEGYKEVIAFAKYHKEQSKRVANNIKLLKKAADRLGRKNGHHLKAKFHTVRIAFQDRDGSNDTFSPFCMYDDNGDCNYAIAMSQLIASSSRKATCKIDGKGNLLRTTPNGDGHDGERFGTDGSYYQGHFNASFQRDGMGFCVDTTLVRCGDWQGDTYTGQVMLHHPGRIYGLDISRYEHDKSKPYKVQVKRKTDDGRDTLVTISTCTVDIDWSDLRITSVGSRAPKIEGKVDYPVDFIFIKCSEGQDWLNRYYNADLDSCLAHKIPVSAYHFYSHKSAAKDQAANFVRNGRLNEGTMLPMLDVEPNDSQLKAMGGINGLLKGMVVFVREVEAATGLKCVLYLNQSFVRSYWHLFPEELKQCDIWLAKYHAKHPYTKYNIWQFADDGHVKGIVGDVDINVFNGNRKEFEKWLNKKK